MRFFALKDQLCFSAVLLALFRQIVGADAGSSVDGGSSPVPPAVGIRSYSASGGGELDNK
jgi:hypothetical protein